jgi:thiamine pyrophosphokinase
MPAEERLHDRQDTIVVIAAGAPGESVRARLPEAAYVVAADGGVDAAIALGLQVGIAVGDFDSVTPGALAQVEADGARVERHPPDKDATDLELALDAALGFGARRIVVVGDAGGRLDHLLAGVLLLGHERYADVELDALLGPATVHIVRRERTLTGASGELISLLPLNGPTRGVSTEGLAYPLRSETLGPGSTRGVSNVFTGSDARVSVVEGVLAAVRPGLTERSGT